MLDFLKKAFCFILIMAAIFYILFGMLFLFADPSFSISVLVVIACIAFLAYIIYDMM